MPPAGLEPTTSRLLNGCSTNRAPRATHRPEPRPDPAKDQDKLLGRPRCPPGIETNLYSQNYKTPLVFSMILPPPFTLKIPANVSQFDLNWRNSNLSWVLNPPPLRPLGHLSLLSLSLTLRSRWAAPVVAPGSSGYFTDLGIPSIALSPAELAAGHSMLLGGCWPLPVSWSFSPSRASSSYSTSGFLLEVPTATPQARLRLRVSQPAGLHLLEHVELLSPAGILASPDTLQYHTLAGGDGIARAAAALTPSSLSPSLTSPLLLDPTQRPAPGLGSPLLSSSLHARLRAARGRAWLRPPPGAAPLPPVHILLPSPSRHVPLLGPPLVARKPL